MKLIQSTDYTKGSNTQVTLTKPLCAGALVEFEVFKSIDGSNAETVVQQVYNLQTVLNKTKITADDGTPKLLVTDTTENVLDAFIGLGIGFHTVYAEIGVQGLPNIGTFRMFGQITNITPADGYIIAMQTDGSIYANCINEGVWRGWKSIYETMAPMLYYSVNGIFPDANVTITPAKPLSDCRHGWALTFSGYSEKAHIATDLYIQTVYIPKRSYKTIYWNGESMTFPLVYSYDESTDNNLQCTKTFNVYYDKIVSSAFNSQGKARNMVLRSIQEY